MLSLLIKTFEQILKNGEQIQNVYNIYKVWRTNSKIQNVESNVFTLENLILLEKVLISFDINSYMFKSLSQYFKIFFYI